MRKFSYQSNNGYLQRYYGQQKVLSNEDDKQAAQKEKHSLTLRDLITHPGSLRSLPSLATHMSAQQDNSRRAYMSEPNTPVTTLSTQPSLSASCSGSFQSYTWSTNSIEDDGSSSCVNRNESMQFENGAATKPQVLEPITESENLEDIDRSEFNQYLADTEGDDMMDGLLPIPDSNTLHEVQGKDQPMVTEHPSMFHSNDDKGLFGYSNTQEDTASSKFGPESFSSLMHLLHGNLNKQEMPSEEMGDILQNQSPQSGAMRKSDLISPYSLQDLDNQESANMDYPYYSYL